MADIRIKDLATTASSTAADDFLAVDGTTNGTRKLSAATPSFATSVTVPGVAGPTATDLTLAGGSTGASLVLGQGANANATLTPTGTGSVLLGSNGVARGQVAGVNRNGSLGPAAVGTTTNAIWRASNISSSLVMDIGLDGNASPYPGYIQVSDYANLATSYPLSLNPNGGNLLIGKTTDSGNGKLQLATHTTSAGGIGFGTDVSLYRYQAGGLSVSSTSGAPALTWAESGTNRAFTYFSAGHYLGTYGAHPLIFQTNTTTALTINTNQSATFAGAVTVTGSNSNYLTVASAGITVNSALKVTDGTTNWYTGLLGASVDSTGKYQVFDTASRLSIAPSTGIVSISSTTPSTGAGSGGLQVAGGIYSGAASYLNATTLKSDTGLKVERTSSDELLQIFGGTTFGISVTKTTGTFRPLAFYTSDSERMRIAADGTVTVQGAATFAGDVTRTGSGDSIIKSVTTGTTSHGKFNTVADVAQGTLRTEGSATSGTLFSTNRASATQLYSESGPLVLGAFGAYSAVIGTNNVARLTIDSTGAATFAGAVAINNTVATAVAVASTHKVTMVIGGVTYYLLASNV